MAEYTAKKVIHDWNNINLQWWCWGGGWWINTDLLFQWSVHKWTLCNPNCSGDSLCSYTFQWSWSISNMSYCTICWSHNLIINGCNLWCVSNYQWYTINTKPWDVIWLCYVHWSHYNSCTRISLCYVDIY